MQLLPAAPIYQQEKFTFVKEDLPAAQTTVEIVMYASLPSVRLVETLHSVLEEIAVRINDQGYTGIVFGGSTRNTGVSESKEPSFPDPSISNSERTGLSDNTQISSLASVLQRASNFDLHRSATLAQIARTLNDNNFEVDPAKISSAIVSEALQDQPGGVKE